MSAMNIHDYLESLTAPDFGSLNIHEGLEKVALSEATMRSAAEEAGKRVHKLHETREAAKVFSAEWSTAGRALRRREAQRETFSAGANNALVDRRNKRSWFKKLTDSFSPADYTPDKTALGKPSAVNPEHASAAEARHTEANLQSLRHQRPALTPELKAVPARPVRAGDRSPEWQVAAKEVDEHLARAQEKLRGRTPQMAG